MGFLDQIDKWNQRWDNIVTGTDGHNARRTDHPEVKEVEKE